jgi:hypothetical protein
MTRNNARVPNIDGRYGRERQSRASLWMWRVGLLAGAIGVIGSVATLATIALGMILGAVSSLVGCCF